MGELIDGVARCRVDQLQIGQRVDLEGDIFADPDYCPSGEAFSQHPEFQFEFETVAVIERESADCIRVDFESGFSCGFPPEHMVDVDGEQILQPIQTCQNSGGYFYAWRGDMEAAGKAGRLAGAYPTKQEAIAALETLERAA